ncbi:MAG: phosphoribosyl-AMP cyclohydrolase [Pseudomonadota bacterium]
MTQNSDQTKNAPDKESIEETDRFTPKFDSHGLIPAIVMDAETNDVAMFAWMNAFALSETQRTGLAHFWSRSRKKIWCKGEESGNLLRVRKIRTDCDQDCLLIDADVEGKGAACHTMRKSCFYRELGAVGDDGSTTLTFSDD